VEEEEAAVRGPVLGGGCPLKVSMLSLVPKGLDVTAGGVPSTLPLPPPSAPVSMFGRAALCLLCTRVGSADAAEVLLVWTLPSALKPPLPPLLMACSCWNSTPPPPPLNSASALSPPDPGRLRGKLGTCTAAAGRGPVGPAGVVVILVGTTGTGVIVVFCRESRVPDVLPLPPPPPLPNSFRS